jgi:hypothetical protein
VAFLGVAFVALPKASELEQTDPSATASSAAYAVADASWHERYATVEDAMRGADEVVLAIVTGSRPGRIISAGGVDRLR